MSCELQDALNKDKWYFFSLKILHYNNLFIIYFAPQCTFILFYASLKIEFYT